MSYINYIGTANPTFKTAQKQIAQFMANALALNTLEKHQLEVLYRASGIQTRYSVIEDYQHLENYTFFPNTQDLEPFPTVDARMRLYEREAIQLCEKAVYAALPITFDYHQISHLITVSCTGMYAPGIDIQLIQRFSLRTDIQRTAINFMGCYAAFNALKTADYIIKAQPDAKVLVVAVELCSIHLQKAKNADTLLANALFGDGAAAALLSGQPNEQAASFQIQQFYSDLALDGIQEMAWRIGDFGFDMKLTSVIPDIIRANITQLISRLLQKMNIGIEDIDYFAMHPGGKRILRVIEEELNINKTKNQIAHQVLRDYGNMSSPTILFVMNALKANLQPSDHQKKVLGLAFGPGLTLESMLINIHYETPIMV
ncbi:MAG: type III polyketide synthase [Saprospiraceae bacterium]|nr:type III polyketide synthase [Saprospiraceae bacterium]